VKAILHLIFLFAAATDVVGHQPGCRTAQHQTNNAALEEDGNGAAGQGGFKRLHLLFQACPVFAGQGRRSPVSQAEGGCYAFSATVLAPRSQPGKENPE
jgi:hypothetical protein